MRLVILISTGIISLVFAAAIAVALCTGLVDFSRFGEETSPGSSAVPCVACPSMTRSISKHMNMSVDPCENFFQYSCGGFIADNSHILGGEIIDRPDSFRRLDEKKKTRRREVLAKEIKRDEPKSYERKIKQFFQSCTDKDAREKHGAKPLMSKMKSKLSWYILGREDWADKWNVNVALSLLHTELQVNAFFKINKEVAVGGNSPIAFKISPEYVRVPSTEKEPNGEDKYMQSVVKLAVRDAEPNLNDSAIGTLFRQLKEDVDDMRNKIQFISNNSHSGAETLPVGELQKKLSTVNISSIVSNLAPGYANDTTMITVTNPNYFRSIDKMLQDTDSLVQRMINNYMMWSVLDNYKEHLSLASQMLDRSPNKSAQREVQDRCANVISMLMPPAFMAVVTKDYVNSEARNQIQGIFNNIKEAMHRNVDDISWLKDKRKNYVLGMIKKMMIKFQIEIANDTQVDEMYAKLHLDIQKSYLENVMTFKAFDAASPLSEGEYFVKTKELLRFPRPSRYTKKDNILSVDDLNVPDAPYFSRDYPQSVNFGAMGSHFSEKVITGMNIYDVFGNETQCFSSYFNATKEGQILETGNALRWIVFEAMAIKLGYRAYIDWLESNVADPLLPGLNLTQHQLYFVSATQSRCEVLTNSVSTNELRINGILANTAGFQKAFECQSHQSLVSASEECIPL